MIGGHFGGQSIKDWAACRRGALNAVRSISHPALHHEVVELSIQHQCIAPGWNRKFGIFRADNDHSRSSDTGSTRKSYPLLRMIQVSRCGTVTTVPAPSNFMARANVATTRIETSNRHSALSRLTR